MSPQETFQYEFEYSELPASEVMDSRGSKVTTVKCHGKLVAENRGRIEEIFKRTPFQGHIIFDLADLNYLDSAGLGALMRLKLSAVMHGGVSVKFEHMTPRVMQLLSIANLTDWFTS
ncbi:MAG: STAS domain-containing protein [Acidobacteriaceae bacterium]|nr:STAS domain-containing protein [Acidobacteriaceae bacterium]